MPRPTRWATETAPGHSRWLIDHFAGLRESGADLAGEARFVDALIAPGSVVLDAGCGTGRVGAALAARGHPVVGVDADPELLAEARASFPGPRWLLGDLTELDAVLGDDERFDAAVLAGNIMPFLAPDTETEVLRQVLGRLKPDAPAAIGFEPALGYSLADFDRHLAEVGATAEQRFATWDLRPWSAGSPFAVTVVRRA